MTMAEARMAARLAQPGAPRVFRSKRRDERGTAFKNLLELAEACAFPALGCAKLARVAWLAVPSTMIGCRSNRDGRQPGDMLFSAAK
jgi:hypothetical protein